jgi:phosphate transport system substrate-binding protein
LKKNSLILVLIAALVGCAQERKETPTKGFVKVVASEDIFPIISQEKAKFEELYPDAKVELAPALTREAIVLLLNDSAKLIVASRPLNNEEREVKKKADLTIAEFKIAYDGIAVIVNNTNDITKLRTTQLDSIFRGTATTWNGVGGTSKTQIKVCLPSRNSGTFESVEALVKNEHIASPAAVVQSAEEMVRYVSTEPDAIGLLSLYWLKANKEKVKALELADPDAPDSLGVKGEYFGPHQAYVYQKYYPLRREIWIYSRSDHYSVGNGFISFVLSAPGQKIVLNNGLVPATMPIRLVDVTSRNLQ